MPERAKSGVADDRTWTLSGEGAALPDGRPVIVTAVEGPWVPYGESVQVVPVARLEQAQAKARESDAKIDVLCEAAARLSPLPREPEPGRSDIVPVAAPDGKVRIEYDPWDEDAMRQARAHVDQVVEDTVASVRRSEGVVDFRGVSEGHVRYIARRAARLALLMDRNPDREPRR